MNSRKKDSPMLVPSPKDRLKLEDIFHRLAEERRKKVYGERFHAKFVGLFYRLEYDFWEKETSEDPEDTEILGFNGDESFNFRHNQELRDSWKLMLGYQIRKAYFEESVGFLKTLDLDIARTLTKKELWSQADEKNTLVSTNISVPNFDEIYNFVKEHIKYTIKNH